MLFRSLGGGVVQGSDCAAGALKSRSSVVTIGAFSNVDSIKRQNILQKPSLPNCALFMRRTRPILLGQMFTTCRFTPISPSSLIPDPRCSPQISLLTRCATSFIGMLSSSNSGTLIISYKIYFV